MESVGRAGCVIIYDKSGADKRVNLMAALHINVSIIQAYPINSESNQ
jgi:hypothetical protein